MASVLDSRLNSLGSWARQFILAAVPLCSYADFYLLVESDPEFDQQYQLWLTGFFFSESKEEILANLANFAYDPINYEHFRKLNVVDLFLGKENMLTMFLDVG